MSRKISFLVAIAIVILTAMVVPHSVNAAGPTVSVVMTTGDQTNLLAQQPSATFATDSGSNPLTITVNPSTKYQTMDGWGASITDSSAYLMWNSLSTSARASLMNDLFNKSTGIGLSFLRQPMGASDLSASGIYSYDDGAADPNLNNFSINHDTTYIIPILKQAFSINPSIKIMDTPWSPPGWMKTSGSMVGGNMQTQYYSSLAAYFVKTIQAYQAQGLPIYALSVQNEPLYIPAAYPGMGMPATEERDFIKNFLGPALANAGLTPKVMVYDHNWDQPTYPTTIFSDASASAYVAGVAWHCYAGDVSAELTVHNQYPNKDTWETECSGGSWAPVFASNLQWDTENLVILNARNWGKAGVTWNMALDPNGGPNGGDGCTTCRGVVTINESTGTYVHEVEYYALGQASKFVDSGAYRIDSNTFGNASIEDVAFQNPDSSMVVLALNNATTAQTFKVLWNGQSFSYTLPVGAVVTFKWSGIPPTAGPSPTPTQTLTPSVTPTITNTPIPSATPTLTNTPLPTSAFNQIEAENWAAMFGVQTESCSDTGGGLDVGWADTGDWIEYAQLNFGAGAASLNLRVAGQNSGGIIEFHLDSTTGPKIASYTMVSTGGWQTWNTVTVPVSGASSVHNLFIVYQNGNAIGNLNWFKFATGGVPTNTSTFVPPTNTPTFVPATNTATFVPPTSTPKPTLASPTNTPVPPTATATSGGISTTAWYNVINQNSGSCVDAAGSGTSNGTVVQQWACGASPQFNQEWQFQTTDSGYYKVMNRNAPALAWDVTGGAGSTGDGVKIQLWTFVAPGGTNQQWMPVALGGGYYKFVARNSGTECLDVTNLSTANGVQLQQWTCTGATNQAFRLTQQP